jgi:hypothetical protein
MATKKTKDAAAAAAPVAAPAAPGAALAAARIARETAASNDKFMYVQDLTKGAPQAKMIVEILKGAGKKGLTRKELCEAMVGKVVTRQPQSRILGYYQKDLVASGAISLTKTEVATAAAA